MLRATFIALLLLNHGMCSLPRLAPWFVSEPPPLVRYASGAGARLQCVARGDPPPTLVWLRADGEPLLDASGIRRVYSNGTLEILPSANYHSGDGGGGGGGGGVETLRCRAVNAHGVALSRDIMLQPVGEVRWEALLTSDAVAEGGVAALRCRASEHAALVRAELWYRAERPLAIHAPNPDARYIVAGDALLIRDVTAADAGPYSCLARHSLTGVTKRSRTTLLTVTAGSTNTAPRLLAGGGELSVAAGGDVCLPCVTSDHPPPHYTWYREVSGRLQPVEAAAGGVWLWAGGAALCVTSAVRRHAGAWLCKAYNVFGDATAQMRLEVTDELTVTVAPTVVRADSGSTVRLNCSASDLHAALRWTHDGAPLAAGGEGGTLVLRGVGRAHRGLYQCFARRAHDSAQASAEIRLGDSPPELQYTFIEQALRAGGSVSLRCAASGSPPPRVTWLLDAQPLDSYRAHHRYSIGEETTPAGDVVSALNISGVTAADGGRYTCQAQNRLGAVDHSARLNIYGPPSIRALGAVRVVAGANATVYCPYAGYPISSISWWRRGASVAVAGAGRVSARGAALRLTPALPPDAGHYACAVAAPDGPAARRDIEIQVRNPPKISPFMFSSELTEGSSVQVLCGVSSGDKPMYFSWLKDGAPLPSNLQIEEKSLNEFSLLMFSDLTAQHSGEYTCRVSNHAAAVNYTATLSVKVAPAWVTEPLDAAVLLGAPLLLECAAKGHPTPTITWYRKISERGGLGAEGEQWEAMSGGWGDAGGAGGAGVEGGLRVRNGSLVAAAAVRRHQGYYRCTADNGVGVPLLKHVNVTVHEPAHFSEPGSNGTCVRGRSAALSCLARGDAPLAVHWTHRGIRIDLNSYRWTVTEAVTGEGLRSTLALRAAERGDAGEYRCLARNQYGSSEQLLYLRVEEPPEAPLGLRLAGVGARWVRLQWRGDVTLRYAALCAPLHALPGAEPRALAANLTLHSALDDTLTADGLRTLSAKLETLRPASAYSLRVAAANHVGQSPHSEPLVFTTLEEAPTASPQNVRVRPASPGELHVSWSAPHQDSWNGELLGYVATWRELGSRGAEEEGGNARGGRLAAPGWSSTELTVGGLRSFSRYAVSMRAYNRAGAGPPSPIVYATTSDGVPELPPSSVTCEGIMARSLQVRWSPPPATHVHLLRGFDVHYAPFHFYPSWSGANAAEQQTARVGAGAVAGAGGEATLQGLAPATNYSVWVRARAETGLGPPSAPVYCATAEDVPGAVEAVRALAAGADAVRVTWLPPARRAGRLTHYTLHTRELGKVGGEWSQRVEAGLAGEGQGEGEEEVWREVRGLRAAVHEVWVRAATGAGLGPPSRPVTAAPAHPVSARISSFSRVIHAAWGTRVRLRCAAVGAPPLRWRWSPLPPAHTLTDTGDLIIHKVEVQSGGNYTCSVRNAGGADAAVFRLAVRREPGAPIARLVRADTHALHLAWDAPADGGVPLLGYTLTWERDGDMAASGAGGKARVPPSDTVWTLSRLACGAKYRVTVRAHNAVGASPPSRPLLIRTRGDKSVAAPGKELVWANSSALRLNLLAWRARCPVASWSVSLRPAAGRGGAAAAWRDLPTDGESAVAGGLRAGAWYEVRVLAHSAAGDTAALYRAPTRTLAGGKHCYTERIGEAVEVTTETRSSATDAAEGEGAAGVGRAGAWRAPLLLSAGVVALLAALAGMVAARRCSACGGTCGSACSGACSGAGCVRRECSLRAVCPHPQLYSTEPGKRNGKALTPPDDGELEISPYATFSMSGNAGGAGSASDAGSTAVGARGCALHLHTFGRAEALDLAAPPRPNLLSHSGEYGRSHDSDSESSGSPCAACAADLYRLPAVHLSDTLPVESSAEDTSYSAGGRGSRLTVACRPERLERSDRAERSERSERSGRSELGVRQVARGKRRREHARHSSGPTVRYLSAAPEGTGGASGGAGRRDAL